MQKQKETRGIYNTTFNEKKATPISISAGELMKEKPSSGANAHSMIVTDGRDTHISSVGHILPQTDKSKKPNTGEKMKKYELTNETISHLIDGFIKKEKTLYRIKALIDFHNVKKGDLGGYIESENNLSQEGICWVYNEAKVYDNAVIYGNARIYGKVEVCGNAQVFGNALMAYNSKAWENAKVYEDAVIIDNAIIDQYAEIYGTASISDNAVVFGNARVYDDAMICDKARIRDNAQVYGNAYIYGNAEVSFRARVFDNAQVFGNCLVVGDAKVFENAKVYGEAHIFDKAKVYGNAKAYGEAWIYKDAEIYGDTTIKDLKISKTPYNQSHSSTISQKPKYQKEPQNTPIPNKGRRR